MGAEQDQPIAKEHPSSETAMNDVTVRLQTLATKLDDLRVPIEDEERLDRVLDGLIESARRAIPAAVAASITLLVDEDQTAWTPTATDDAAAAIDGVQYVTGQGPCLEAARTRRPVRVRIDDIRDRWPAFADAADSTGMHSYLSVPLVLGDEPVLGALNTYGRAADAFDPIDQALLSLFTAAASAVIVHARRYLRSRDLASNMKAAMESRATIEQAKGVLMAQQRSRRTRRSSGSYANLSRPTPSFVTSPPPCSSRCTAPHSPMDRWTSWSPGQPCCGHHPRALEALDTLSSIDA
jgi:GAF domain-containing protein